MPSIGRDLLDIPFAEMVRNLAIAIADGQTALDRNSLNTLSALLQERVSLVTEISEVIEPEFRTITVGGQDIEVTGVRITPSAAPAVEMNMVQAGLLPTFYQFTEASIDVGLSITMRQDTDETSVSRTAASAGSRPFFLGTGPSRAYASSVDFRSAAKYQYSAQGASRLRAVMRPVPPPARLEPAVTTINALTSPPTVSRSPG